MTDNCLNYERTPLGKKFLFKTLFVLVVLFSLFACSDDTPDPLVEIESPGFDSGDSPYAIIEGPDCINSGHSSTYTLNGDLVGITSIQWTSEGNITIIGSTTGTSVLVQAGANYSSNPNGKLTADITYIEGGRSIPVFRIDCDGVIIVPQGDCLPDIFAIDENGPNTTHSAGTFVDFHPAPGPQQFPGVQFEWSSYPQIPGMTSSGSHILMKTVYIPPTTPSGEYVVVARDPASGCFTAIEFNIVNGSGSGGGSGGGPGGQTVF